MTTDENDSSARLEAVYATHGRSLLRFLRSLTRNERHVAEDLFQETMLRAWRHLESLPVEEENARRWLFTIARRVAIDAARMRQARPAEVSLIDAGNLATDDDSTEQALARYAIAEAFIRLSQTHQAILHELYLRGRTTGEAAERLGVPVGTVKSRAHYALRSLRTAVGTVN